jgi:hypothetical protein
MGEPVSAIMFRPPLPLKREIEQAARENQRSMAKEVLYRVQQSFREEHRQRRRDRPRRRNAPAVPATRVQAVP